MVSLLDFTFENDAGTEYMKAHLKINYDEYRQI